MGCASSSELERSKGELKRSQAEANAGEARMNTALLLQLNPEQVARVKAQAVRLEAKAVAARSLPPRLMAADTFRAEIAAFQNAGDLAMLVAGARVHLADAAVQAAAMLALNSLMMGAKNPNTSKIYALGGLPLILDVLHAHEMERAVVEPACGALRNLTVVSSDQAAICAKTGEPSVISRLLNVADAFPGELAVLEHVVAVLVSVMAYNPNNTATIVVLGGMSRLMEMMDRHPDVSGLQESVCMALFNLTFAGPAAQARLKALGVEERVRTAMAAANATVDTKKWGQKLLDKLPAESASEREKLGEPHHPCSLIRNLLSNSSFKDRKCTLPKPVMIIRMDTLIFRQACKKCPTQGNSTKSHNLRGTAICTVSDFLLIF